MKNFNIGKLGIESLTNEARQVIFDLVYPIGSYLSIDNPNFDTVAKVNAYYGGSWERIKGRVLYAADNNVGVDEGSNTITLTTEQLPAHTHTRGSMNITGGFDPWGWSGEPDGDFTGAFYKGSTGRNSYAVKDGGDGYRLEFDAARNWIGETSSVGSGASINIKGAVRRTYIYHRIG